MSALKILSISGCCLIAGAAGICLVTTSPTSLLFAPLFAVFGWFYLFPICALVALMWGVYRVRFTALPWCLLFILLGAVLGGGLMALDAAIQFNAARDLPLHDGLVLGGILAGGTSNLMITLMKRSYAEPATAGNAIPATQVANS